MTGIKNNRCRIQLPQHWKKQPFREDVMPKTTDPRTLQTKAQIRKTLLELLQKAPFSKLTVKELCARAGINRGTFYALKQSAQVLFPVFLACAAKLPIFPAALSCIWCVIKYRLPELLRQAA